jgi:uncharacterized membrane protein YdbT with pleckstrin-like domain
MEEFELETGEKVIRSIRLHPFVLVLQLVPFILCLFLPAIISFLISLAATMNPAALALLPNSAGAVRFFMGIWYLLVWTAAFSLVTRYYLTVWVITNLRIVDIKQRSFFNREVSSFLLARVQDITTDISGVLGTLIGFGKLSVETAGKDEEFQMENISHPQAVRDVIMSQVAQMHHPDILGGGL